MTEKLLKAKHWQIFLITCGLPFLIQIVFMVSTLVGDDPAFMMQVFPFFMVLFIGGLLGWFWSIGVGLQSKVPLGVKMKAIKFKVFLIIPLVYMTFISIFTGGLSSGFIETGQEVNEDIIGSMIGIIVPLHLLSMFGMFYCLYFVAKTFKTVELQREVSFSDCAGEFFMFWFFPVGIWIVQPKINQMMER